ncbi:MAG: agmatinase [Clostridia bacterium]
MSSIKSINGCNNKYKEAKIVVFGAPYDSTTSFRPGTRFASLAIRNDSWGLETYSPYLDKDLEDIKVHDAGDLEFSFGNNEKMINLIYEQTNSIINDKKIPLMIGGEHLVTYGAVKATFKHYKDLKVLHFDAHSDLRDTFFDEKLSHATVMRRVYDLIGDNKIFQFGIRSGSKEEFEWSKGKIYTQKFNLDNLDTVIDNLKSSPVYVTIDLDILDPSVFPGTGTPEPGGVSFIELLKAIHKLNILNIVGCDINELSPHYDQSGASTAVAAKILRELLLTI